MPPHIVAGLARLTCLVLAAGLTGKPGWAQEGESAAEPAAQSHVLGGFDAYGRFLAHVAVFNDQAEVQDNASWVGATFSVGEGVSFFAGLELAVTFIRATQFNAGAVTGGSPFVEEEAASVFGIRLGFLGVDFGRAGSVSLGKQNSVHYDIAGYTTDQFNVFGGQGSQAYPAGTDGGTFGTGRVDQAVQYRVPLGRLQVGGQLQLRTATGQNFADGFGASARLSVFPGLTVGGAYTRTSVEQEEIEGARGLDGDGEFAIVGARYESEAFDLGVVYTTQKNGDAARFPTDDDPATFVPVFFDAEGLELFAKLKPGRFSIIGGVILNDPQEPLDPALPDDFGTRYAILGGEFWFRPNAYAYAEWRVDDSVSFDAQQGFNVFTLGLRYGFSLSGSTGQY